MVRWLIPSVVPAVLFLLLVYRSDREREPPWVVAGTFALGMLGALGAFYVERSASKWTGLDLRTQVAGNAGALLFLCAFVVRKFSVISCQLSVVSLSEASLCSLVKNFCTFRSRSNNN